MRKLLQLPAWHCSFSSPPLCPTIGSRLPTPDERGHPRRDGRTEASPVINIEDHGVDRGQVGAGIGPIAVIDPPIGLSTYLLVTMQAQPENAATGGVNRKMFNLA
ncbi:MULTISPECIES: hypothetical protein [unclassified Streptomyces]|uniref:hypothetical protein n=1 Tax=unclassified Streptomyces TaxID=2593676 RepID=UPI0033292BB9